MAGLSTIILSAGQLLISMVPVAGQMVDKSGRSRDPCSFFGGRSTHFFIVKMTKGPFTRIRFFLHFKV